MKTKTVLFLSSGMIFTLGFFFNAFVVFENPVVPLGLAALSFGLAIEK